MIKNILRSINNNNSNVQICVGSSKIQTQDNSVTVNGKTISVPGSASISCYNGKTFINGKEVNFDKDPDKEYKVIHLTIQGDVVNINCDCSVEVKGNVGGNIDCNGSVKVGGDMHGDIDCNGSVVINGNHVGDIDALGSVSIK